jgi:hypothetical protein
VVVGCYVRSSPETLPEPALPTTLRATLCSFPSF